MIIGLYGCSRAGKDSVGKILVEEHDFERRALADPIRAVLKEMNLHIVDQNGDGHSLTELVEMYGWDCVKKVYPESVEMMIGLGNGMRKHVHPDVWISGVLGDAHLFKGPIFCRNLVITDVRFLNEYKAVIKEWGAMWKIQREGCKPRGMDNQLEEQEFDAVIENNGTLEDLRKCVNLIMSVSTE